MTEKRGYDNRLVTKGDKLITGYRKNPLDKGDFKIHQEEDAVDLYVKAGMTKGEAYKRAGDMVLESAESDKGSWTISNPRKTAIKLYEEAAKYGDESASKELEVLGVRVSDRYKNEETPVTSKEGLKGLERKSYTLLFAVMSGGGLFLLSANITGSVILNLSRVNASVIGVSLFLTGIAGLFFSFKKSRQKKE